MAVCVFVAYAGTSIRPTHPLMRARIATHNNLAGARRVLGPELRAVLGLPLPSTAPKANSAPR